MQRIQVLTKAREGILPVDLEVKYKVLHDNLKELLNPNPWHRSDLNSVTQSLTKEELSFRIRSAYSQRILFMKEEDSGNATTDTWSEKRAVVKDNMLLIYSSDTCAKPSKSKFRKAEMIYSLEKYEVKFKHGIVRIQNPFVCGCQLMRLEEEEDKSFKKFVQMIKSNSTACY